MQAVDQLGVDLRHVAEADDGAVGLRPAPRAMPTFTEVDMPSA